MDQHGECFGQSRKTDTQRNPPCPLSSVGTGVSTTRKRPLHLQAMAGGWSPRAGRTRCRRTDGGLDGAATDAGRGGHADGLAPGDELSLVSDCVRQVTIRENRFLCADGVCDLLACHTAPVKGQTCPMRHKERI